VLARPVPLFATSEEVKASERVRVKMRYYFIGVEKVGAGENECTI
jgi:hypothetical protein